MFKNKTIMITGGTGSFGEALLNKLLNLKVKEIRIFSRDEKKQEDLRIKHNKKNIKFIIGDVRDYKSIRESSVGVDFLFHAAALKQVPSCEFFPLEAVNTNIIGTENTLNAAIENSIKRVIVLSTDKAVYPINAMGISKAMAEKIAISKSRYGKNTIICITRYGNVMGSRGSVIPLFKNQISEGKSITVTNPNMTRFLMTLEESVDLVLYAFKYGKPGDIFVKKSPATSISILAEAISSILKSKSELKIIGTRHGEKMYETLISREESLRLKDLKSFYKISNDSRDLNYSLYFSKGKKKKKEFEYNSDNTKQLNFKEVVKLLNSKKILKGSFNA